MKPKVGPEKRPEKRPELKRESGTSLLELLVAASIFVVILFAGIEVYLLGVKNYRRIAVKASLSQDAVLLGSYMRKVLQQIGGGSVAPAAATWVEDNCAARSGFPDCAGSDRITAVRSTEIQECTATEEVGSSLLKFGTAADCCLTNAYKDKQLVLTLGPHHVQRSVSQLNLSECALEIVQGPASGGDEFPVGLSLKGATATVVSISTIYLDVSTTELKVRNFQSAADVAASTPPMSLATNVLDFQVALGFDFNPVDERIRDEGSVDDEWIYNASDGQEEFGKGSFSDTKPSSLRMLMVGLVLAKPAAKASVVPTFQILNGPQRSQSGLNIESIIVRVFPRNLYLFK